MIALGSPLLLQNTVTAGIISAVARHSSELGLSQQRTEYIQTDAAINQGNSGGPLVNLDGEVIGINTLKLAGVDGIGFAIPMDIAQHVIGQLKATGKVVRPYIGMQMVTLDQTNRERLPHFSRSHDKGQTGVMVIEVQPGSPAARAGLSPGDLIVSFADQSVSSVNGILSNIGMEVDKKIPLRAIRHGTGKEEALTIVTRAREARE